MALRIFDRVKQVTSSTGTGNITLGGTPNGFQSFSDVFSSGDTTYICIENGSSWEVSRATYGVAGSGTLSRDTILDSSTGAAINLSGRSTVFCTVPAAKYAYLDPSGEINLSLGGLSDATITSPATGNILSYNGSQWVNSVPDPGYSDEQAQDAIGGILGSGTDIVLSYNDSTPAITGALTNTTVTPGSYTLSSITVDQKGRITAASSGSVDLSSYLTSATAASTYVPYTGATSGLNLGAYALSCGAITTSSDIVLTGSANGIYLNPANVNKGLIYFSAGQNRLNGISSVPWVVESDAGFKVRNSANSADAALTCGAITASSLLSLQNSTTPMEFNLHNTYTSATSREYLKMLAVTGGAYQIGSAIGSAGGTNRAITFGHWNAGGSFTSSLSIDTTANQVQIGTIKAGYNTSFSTGVYGINLNNGSPNCTIWSGDSSAFGSSFSGYNVFMVGHDVGTLSGFGIGSYPKFVYSNGSTLSIPQICVGNPSGFSGLDLALGTTGTPTDGEYTVTSGYGTNKAGASMWLMAGRSTGSGAGGSVYIGTSNTGSSGTTRNTNLTLAQFNSTAITFSRDLLFTDATYDIGKSGATRPRDGFFSRNVTIGGTATFAGAIVADGVAWTGKTFYQTGYSSVGWGLSAGNWYFGNGASDWKFGLHASGGVQIFSGTLGFNGNLAGSANDLEISRDAADILAQRRGTNAQTFRLAETYTSSTSFGAFQIKANAGAAYQIGSAIGSAGGTNRDLSFGQWNSAGTFSNLLNISGASGGSTVRIATTSGAGTCGLEFGSTLSGWQMGQIKVSYDSLGGWGTGFDFVINAGSGPSHLATLFSISSRGRFVFTQLADASGSPTAFTLIGAAHTTLTASTEATDANFNFARTVQFSTGALTTQRAMRIQAPTYSFVGASTITTASTLSISGAPAAGTNATITNAYALNVESGDSYFAGAIRLPSSSNGIYFSASGNSAGRLSMFGSEFYIDNAAAGGGFIFRVNSAVTSAITIPSTGIAEFHQGIRGTSHVLNVVSSTNAQTLCVYNTYTSSTSFENLQFKANAGAAYQIGSAIGSAGGTTRGVEIGSWDSAGTFSGRFITSNTGVVTINSSGRTTFGVGGGTNIAYFTSNGSFMGLGFNRVGVYGVGLRCDNGYSVSICAHNNDEASAWGPVFTVQTLTSGSNISGKITTMHGAATNLPASTEATDADFNFARTVQFATGALTTQRAFRIQAPTYSFVGASTITTASTLSISGAPAAGTNATITNAYALNVESGASYFAGAVSVNNSSLAARYSLNVGTSSFAGLIDSEVVAGFYNAVFSSSNARISVIAGSGGEASLYLGDYSTTRVKLTTSAAGILEQRNSTVAQTFRVAGTWTSTTSYELINIKGKAGANFEIGPENGSAGGTLRGLTIGGYSAGSSTITPWLTFTNAGAATFASTITAADSITTNGLFSSDRYAVSANYRFRRANGTSSSPTQVTSGQAVGALSSFGYHDSGAFHSSAGALVYFVAAENFTSTAHGTNIQFWTTPTTSTTSAKRLCIEASGELTLEAGSHIQTSGAGIKIGTATSQKLGFWNATPVVQQVLATGAGATVDDVIALLQTLGLCKQS